MGWIDIECIYNQVEKHWYIICQNQSDRAFQTFYLFDEDNETALRKSIE